MLLLLLFSTSCHSQQIDKNKNEEKVNFKLKKTIISDNGKIKISDFTINKMLLKQLIILFKITIFKNSIL
jgi:hypothetical protein